MAVALLIISCMRSVPIPSRARVSAFYIICYNTLLSMSYPLIKHIGCFASL